MTSLIIQEFRRRVFNESCTRIYTCLDLLTEDQIWIRPNPASNSIGNLVFHVEGNTRQWILSGLFGHKDTRVRDKEFNTTNLIKKDQLALLLKTLESEVIMTLNQLKDDQLQKTYIIQGFKESGLSVLIHVIEHFSYHTGQISFYTKWLTNQDLGYYSGKNLG